jgi:hypothetical protein
MSYPLYQNTMTHSLDDIVTYEKQALDLIPTDHPHYEEIRRLLVEQVNDMTEDYANSRPNTGTSRI